MSVEHQEKIKLHLKIKSPQGQSETDIIMEEESDNPYVKFLQKVTENMKTQLKYGIYVPRKKAHGQIRSSVEMNQMRENIAKDYRGALSVLNGQVQKTVEIIKRDDEIVGFQVLDTIEGGRKN